MLLLEANQWFRTFKEFIVDYEAALVDHGQELARQLLEYNVDMITASKLKSKENDNAATLG